MMYQENNKCCFVLTSLYNTMEWNNTNYHYSLWVALYNSWSLSMITVSIRCEDNESYAEGVWVIQEVRKEQWLVLTFHLWQWRVCHRKPCLRYSSEPPSPPCWLHRQKPQGAPLCPHPGKQHNSLKPWSSSIYIFSQQFTILVYPLHNNGKVVLSSLSRSH